MRTAGLTERQMQVARLVADGCTVKQIAATLTISSRGVHYHIGRIIEAWRLDPERDAQVQIARRWSAA